MDQIDKYVALEELSDCLAEGFENKFDDHAMQRILISQPGLNWLEQSTEYIVVSLRVVYEIKGRSGVRNYLNRLFKRI